MKCAHGLRSVLEAGRDVISDVAFCAVFGSTGPSSRDSGKGRGIWFEGWEAVRIEGDVATIQDDVGIGDEVAGVEAGGLSASSLALSSEVSRSTEIGMQRSVVGFALSDVDSLPDVLQ